MHPTQLRARISTKLSDNAYEIAYISFILLGPIHCMCVHSFSQIICREVKKPADILPYWKENNPRTFFPLWQGMDLQGRQTQDLDPQL